MPVNRLLRAHLGQCGSGMETKMETRDTAPRAMSSVESAQAEPSDRVKV